MQTFLDDVVKIIYQSNQNLDQVRIIVPSIRAIKFLKESFKKEIKKPIFAPEIISIESFVEDLSGIQKMNQTELLFVFYSIYKKHTPSSEQNSLDQFLSWAPSLLQEFNEIDTQLVDPEAIFSFMKAVERIEQWDPNKEGDISKQFFKFQERVPQYYHNLYDQLLRKQQGYSGVQYREATQNLGHYLESDLPFHYFVGFNALTKSEEIIIQELIAEEKAEILWDLDRSFYEDPYNSASHFIRNYTKEWSFLRQDFSTHFSNYFSNPKNIEVINVTKNLLQAKAAAQLGIKTYREHPEDSIALVLADEGILQPLLTAIASADVPWNASMGYFLKDLGEASFFITLFELLKQYNDEKFPLDLLHTLTENKTTTALLEESGLAIIKMVQQQKLFRNTLVSSKKIMGKSAIGDLMFAPFINPESFIKRMILLSEKMAQYYFKSNMSSLTIYSADRIASVWKSLLELCQAHPVMKTLRDVELVFLNLLEKEKLDFAGDPFTGIQIMGVLETRVLDFDHVIVTHVNEGTLPFGKTPFSWIPFDVRKKFGLNTFTEQDHLYAYHFFRLLQRSKNITLLYNDTADGLFSGEKSRFLIQLEYFKRPKHQLVFKQLDFKINSPKETPSEGEKTPAVLSRIKEVGIQGFSPSSLTQYIRDPFIFYEQRLLKIRPEDSFESDMNAADKGTIIHEVLELLYKPFLDKTLEDKHYQEMLKALPEKLAFCFNKKIQGEGLLTGKNHLIFQVTSELLKRFIESERGLVKKGNSIIVCALEQPFYTAISIEGLEEKIFLKGTVDRIDIFNGVKRIVDYKTGNVSAVDLSFTDWNELTSNYKKAALFQALLYAYALKDDFQNNKLAAGVIPLKNFDNNFLIASLNEKSRKRIPLEINKQVFSSFEKVLFGVIREIFNPKIPFIQNTDL